MSSPLFIVARSFDRANDWARAMGFSPSASGAWTFINSEDARDEDSLRGHDSPVVVVYDLPSTRLAAILAAVRARLIPGRLPDLERTIGCVVEAVGTLTWPEPDDRLNEPQPIARVLDDEGHRHLVTTRLCFRNGTIIRQGIEGERGTIGLIRFTVVWFNCPTLFKRQKP